MSLLFQFIESLLFALPEGRSKQSLHDHFSSFKEDDARAGVGIAATSEPIQVFRSCPARIAQVSLDGFGGVPHTGIMVNGKSPLGRPFLIVHDIGGGPTMPDMLFRWEISGHYRYFWLGA
jgi:hypothetical protein